MRQELANQLAVVIGIAIVVMAVIFAVSQANGTTRAATGSQPAAAPPAAAPQEPAQGQNGDPAESAQDEDAARPANPLVRPAGGIPHPLIGYEDCQACHAPDAMAPYPPSHVGWPDVYCAACHAPTQLD